MLTLVAKLVNRNVPTAVIIGLAEHLTWPAYTVEQTREDLAKMIDGARRKGFGEPDDKGGDDVDDVMAVPPKASPLLPMLTVDELLALPDPEWLIAGLLVENSLAVLYGPFRSYKSFVAIDWALSLATGIDWCGHQVSQCDVLYILGEGVPGTKLRVAAWLQHHGIAEQRVPGFRMIPCAINLMDRAEAQRLILTVVDENKQTRFNPKLVIVETLHRSMSGGDENSAKDMGVVIANAAIIQRELGCTLLPVHHAGKDAERGLRGSSGLPGATDTIIKLTRNDNRATLLVEKQKDAEDGQEIHLRAELVDLPPPKGTSRRGPALCWCLTTHRRIQPTTCRPPNDARKKFSPT